VRLIGDLYDLLLCGAEDRYSRMDPSGQECDALPRGVTVVSVLEVLTTLPIWTSRVKHPATSGFAARAGDAMLDSVVSHSGRDSTCPRARSHAFWLTSRLGSRHTAVGRVDHGPLTELKIPSYCL
jgi:hypothetical protein